MASRTKCATASRCAAAAPPRTSPSVTARTSGSVFATPNRRESKGVTAMGIYDQDLEKNPANYVPLSPVSFIERAAEVYGELPAIVHGARRYLWRETRERTARLAAALRALGVARGTTVSVMLTNTS